MKIDVKYIDKDGTDWEAIWEEAHLIDASTRTAIWAINEGISDGLYTH